jgi:hypothetical protein
VLMLLPVHIVAAGVALLAGLLALFVAKGGRLHRKSGMLFVYALVVMCGAALVLAAVKGQAGNVIASLTTAYLAITALTTVRPPAAVSRRWHVGLMVMAVVLGLVTTGIGIAAVNSRTRTMFGLPWVPFFLFGILCLSGAFGDFKTMRAGVLRGASRLSRHVWRMSMALFITAASFFSIRARVAAIFPAPLTTPAARVIPVLLVLGAMFYWLWRIRFRRRFAERWPASAVS